MSETGFFLLPTNKLYKKEDTMRLKNFPAGYVGSFYRNLVDRVDTSSSDFYSAIANDANIPKEDVQKYLLATSDFAKSMQTDINHYVTRDRINDASFRQKLDPISKNILRRQNPLELVFEDISTFDAENPIVGSLLREVDIRKKQSDSDFIKSIPSHPGKEFEIQKRLDRLRGISSNNNNNNNLGGDGGDGGTNLDLNNYGLNQPPPSLPSIEDFIENGAPLPLPPGGGGQNISFDNNIPRQSTQNNFDIVDDPFVLPNNNVGGNDLFGSVGAMAGPRPEPRQEIDDFLYEIPDTGAPILELGDKLLDTLGVEAEDLFNNVPTKKEEEDEVLQKIIDEYDIPGMKESMDEAGEMPDNIYFFYGGESQKLANTLEFLDLDSTNREFAAFLLSDLGRKTMTQNKLSIHVESGDIFYDNHNTEENFYSFLLSQQNDEAAFVPKKFSYRDTFEKYISSFLPNFSIEDQEKFNLLAFKNSKYLFYKLNDFVKFYGGSRYKLLHTKKMLDSTALRKLAEKNKQYLVEKIIHGVEFENFYRANPEQKPEMIDTIESNYVVARRVYQHLYLDVAELFYEYIQSIDPCKQQDIEEDIKINGWGAVENTKTIKDATRLLNIFQDFYTATGRLSTFNELLIVPDGDAQPEEKINMKQLYDLFKNTGSHGLVSLSFYFIFSKVKRT